MLRGIPDFLIIGGGIVGLSMAREAKRRHPASRVVPIGKENQCGAHASGRNSGVLHAGFYYTADSLKARFTREGNRRLAKYCEELGLRINRCGKLVVARDESELAVLEALLRRGRRNGVELHEREIEPRVKTCRKALWSPTTSSVNPGEVVNSMVADAQAAGVEIITGTAFVGTDRNGVATTRGRIEAGYVINAGGLYADKFARAFGFPATTASSHSRACTCIRPSRRARCARISTRSSISTTPFSASTIPSRWTAR